MKTLTFLFAQLLFISVAFSEINAIYNHNRVEISWNNPKHLEVDYFVIERSNNGEKFKKILTIDASKNKGGFIEYYEVDYKPINKKAYYRIKQVDLNGYTYYSEMATVYNFNNIKSLSKLFPKSKTSSKLKDYKGKQVLVILFDKHHKEFVAIVDVVMKKKCLTATSSSNFLPTGEYVVIGTSDDRIYGEKIVIRSSP